MAQAPDPRTQPDTENPEDAPPDESTSNDVNVTINNTPDLAESERRSHGGAMDPVPESAKD